MKLESKILALITMTIYVMILFTPNIAYAQTENATGSKSPAITAMSPADFLISIDRPDLAAKLGKENKSGAICGDIDNICNENQLCLKCTRYSGEETHVDGFCVAKDTNLSIFTEYQDLTRKLNLTPRYKHTSTDRQRIRDYQDQIKKLLNSDNIYNCEISSSFMNYSGRTAYQNFHQTGNCEFMGGDGKQYCLLMLEDKASIQYADESNKVTRGCEVLPVKLFNYRKCFFCPLVGVIYDGSARITDHAFSKLAAAFATLLAIGFAIWVAIQVLSQVSSLTKQDAPKFLAALIKQSYKVIIAFILLQYSQQVFGYIVRPVLEAGLVFGKNMLTTTEIFEGLDKDKNNNYVRQATKVTGGQHYRLDTYDKLEQYVVAVQREIAFMRAIGTSLLCTGSKLIMLKDWTWTDGKGELIDQFGAGFQMAAQGAVLAIFGFLLSLAFVFYLIDAIVQIGVVGALLPFLIASWPFKATAKYTGTGMQMLLNSAFVFLFVGFVISANIHLINAALNQTADEKQNELLTLCGKKEYYLQNTEKCRQALKDTPRTGALYEIADALNSKDSTRLKDLTDISAMGFLILLFCCFFGFKFTNQAGSLADKFASGSIGKPIAPGIATMGASFAKSAALNMTEKTREAAGDKLERGVKWAVGLAPRGVNALARKIRGKNKPAGGANPQAVRSQTNSPAEDGTAGGGMTGRSGAVLNENEAKTPNGTPVSAANGGNGQPGTGGRAVFNEAAAGGTTRPNAREGTNPTLNEGENPADADEESDTPREIGDADGENFDAEAENQSTGKTETGKKGAKAERAGFSEASEGRGTRRANNVRAASDQRNVRGASNNRQSKGGSARNHNKRFKEKNSKGRSDD